ncbi:MAG: 3-oxoacid CoA-transferase subunit B [Lactobacillus sp.]|jgi:acetate CoA/acetoacetate CoA-transferase beta subunit|nr:3-oxoacid CoA-transferase subunit B [Lactobacillus sp.]
MELTKEKVREIIASRVAKEFKDGDVITLGIGLPTEVANYIPPSINVIFQSENGLLGVGKNATEETTDHRVINAGGVCVETIPGACFYDSAMAFSMMRGGHIDATVLGALQVDEEGNLASWLIPNKYVPGMGGAMDLVVGSKKVIVAMEHCSKNQLKLLKKCNLPLTATKEVDLIVTEKCVIEVTEKGFVLKEINPLFSLEDIKATTEADLIISDNLVEMVA